MSSQPTLRYRVGHAKRVLRASPESDNKLFQRFLDELFQRRSSLPSIHVVDKVIDVAHIVNGLRARVNKSVRTVNDLNSKSASEEDRREFQKKVRRARIALAGLKGLQEYYDDVVTKVEEMVLRVALAEEKEAEGAVAEVEQVCGELKEKGEAKEKSVTKSKASQRVKIA